VTKLQAVVAVTIASAALGAPSAVLAQIPGESAYDTRRSLRDEYRALAYEEVHQAMTEWSEAVNARQLDRLKKSVTETVLYAPMGWSAGSQEGFIDSMKTWLPRMGGYHFVMADFDASGNLAYAYGTVRYHLAGAESVPAGTEVSGEAVIVLYHAGSKWKVRSYIERPLAP
jgi:ketosteroid isomerase-like protein